MYLSVQDMASSMDNSILPTTVASAFLLCNAQCLWKGVVHMDGSICSHLCSVLWLDGYTGANFWASVNLSRQVLVIGKLGKLGVNNFHLLDLEKFKTTFCRTLLK